MPNYAIFDAASLTFRRYVKLIDDGDLLANLAAGESAIPVPGNYTPANPVIVERNGGYELSDGGRYVEPDLLPTPDPAPDPSTGAALPDNVPSR